MNRLARLLFVILLSPCAATIAAEPAGQPAAPTEFAHARITEAWQTYTGVLTFGKGQTLALVDDGCDLSLPEWTATVDGVPKVLVAYDAVDGDDNPRHEGRGYHGSTIGIPSSLNYDGKRGVAFNNQVAIIRGLECCHCNVQDSKTLAAALQWIVDNHEKYHITTVNLAPVDDLAHAEPVASEIDAQLAALRAAGLWVSAPAGNHNFTAGISWPACQPNCFAIGAVQPGRDEIHLDRHEKIDLLVPASATSSSNAIVCGVAMLLREAIEKSGFDWKPLGANLAEAMLAIMQRTGKPVEDSATRRNYRRLDVQEALALVMAPPAATADDADLGDVAESHVMIPMRDGVRLSAWLYTPSGMGPWPVIFEQRYADIHGRGSRENAARLAKAGFVVALVNFRGTHLSDGTWVGYRALQWGALQDGYDACEWFAAQPWSTGKVGTLGSSQGGYAQNYLAVTQPPHLACQYMIDTGLSLFQEGYRIGGTTRPERFKDLAAVCRNPADNRRLLEEWFAHPTFDDYWQAEDASRHFDKMNVPCFTIGSWYDFMNQGSIASFQGRQHQGGENSQGKQQLVIGPWLHGGFNKGNQVGDLVYPENAIWPIQEHLVRWFNHYLKGEDNGVDREPAVRYYAMGAVGEPDAPGNVWRTAQDFSPAAAMKRLYLAAEGKLGETPPDEERSVTSYTSDPLHPMQIPGRAFPGAADARPFEQQAEVRTFTTEPLAAPVEWTGRIQAELFVASTARDTDFLVRVSDVYPDGRSILLVDYPLRARYREGFEKEVLMTPGEVCKLAFSVGWISQVFNAGHRIRVTIASTGAPLYEPNPQTGEPLTIDFPPNAVTATNTIHHERQHASRILVPLAP